MPEGDMTVLTEDIRTNLDAVIRELHANPIDLLSIGDEGEATYLTHARRSYLRTLQDICHQVHTQRLKPHETQILEIGSFLGVVSTVLARLKFPVTALDIPEFMANQRLAEHYQRDGVEMLSVNLRDYAIPTESARYRFVIMCEALEHLNFNPLPVMAEINRVLVDNCHLYISLPNQASLVNRVKLLAGRSIHNPICDFSAQLSSQHNMLVGIHWREYTATELQELLTLSGFSITNSRFFTSHRPSLPARLAYRLVPSLRPNITFLARKVADVSPAFHLRDAVR